MLDFMSSLGHLIIKEDKMNKKIIFLLGLPKTIYINFKCFDFKTAIRMPIILGPDVKIGNVCKGVIELNNYENKRYHVKFGIGGSTHVPKEDRSKIDFGPKAKIVFNGPAMFGEGTSLRCDYGFLTVGKNFSCSKNCCFNCEDSITIGDDVLLGWNIYVRDTDGHDVFENGDMKISQKPVIIKNHCWICSFAHILKGVTIENDSVVAWRSTVTKSFSESNVLLGGTPAKIIKNNITWKK